MGIGRSSPVYEQRRPFSVSSDRSIFYKKRQNVPNTSPLPAVAGSQSRDRLQNCGRFFAGFSDSKCFITTLSVCRDTAPCVIVITADTGSSFYEELLEMDAGIEAGAILLQAADRVKRMILLIGREKEVKKP